MSRPRLPLVVRGLLRLLAPRPFREALIGDLEEELVGVRADRGRLRAWLWSWGQLLSLDWLRLRRAGTSMGRSLVGTPARLGDGDPASRGRADRGRLPRLRQALESIAHDVRFAARTLRRQPRFTATVVTTVGIGIVGAATVIAVIDAVLLEPLPYPDSERLAILQTRSIERGIDDGPVSLVNATEWRRLSDVFEGVAAIQGTRLILTTADETVGLRAARVSAGTLPLLGVAPALGRSFRPDEEVFGRDVVVMLTDELWRTRFGADPGVLGREIVLDGKAREIVGVLPAGFRLPLDLAHNNQRDVLVPLAPEPDEFPRSRRAVSAVARLHEGVSRARAQEALNVAMAAQTTSFPDANDGWEVRARSVAETIVGPFRGVLMMLLGAAALLLLLGCLNVLNLIVAQGKKRERELSVRASLGASRSRVVRQMLAEGILLGVVGGGLGLVATRWLLSAFTSLTPGEVPRLEQAAVDPGIAATILALAALGGVLFSGVPAALLTAREPGEALRGAGPATGSGRSERRVLAAMVVTQVALAVMLLTGAGLLGRSFLGLLTADSGFDSDNLLVAMLVLPAERYDGVAARTRYVDEALGRLESIPGVTHVGLTNFLPYSGTNTVDGFTVDGLVPPAPPSAGFRAVNARYFEALGIATVQGRRFTAEDIAAGGAVAMVNESMARRFWPGGDPVGERITRGGSADGGWMEIVGVVADVRHDGPDAPIAPEWYAPYTRDVYSLKTFVLRTAIPPADLIPAARRQLFEIDPEIPLITVQTMDAYLDEHLAGPRFNVSTMAALAIVALAISAIGIFGVVAHSVARRTHELGVRLALGAHHRRILLGVFTEGLRLALLGVAIGVAGALALARVLGSILVGVGPRDPATLVVVAAAMMLTAAAASVLSARRTTTISPVDALRSE